MLSVPMNTFNKTYAAYQLALIQWSRSWRWGSASALRKFWFVKNLG